MLGVGVRVVRSTDFMGAFGEAKRGLWVRSLYTGQNGSFGFHFFKVYPINLDGNGHKNLSSNKFVIF